MCRFMSLREIRYSQIITVIIIDIIIAQPCVKYVQETVEFDYAAKLDLIKQQISH